MTIEIRHAVLVENQYFLLSYSKDVVSNFCDHIFQAYPRDIKFSAIVDI